VFGALALVPDGPGELEGAGGLLRVLLVDREDRAEEVVALRSAEELPRGVGDVEERRGAGVEGLVRDRHPRGAGAVLGGGGLLAAEEHVAALEDPGEGRVARLVGGGEGPQVVQHRVQHRAGGVHVGEQELALAQGPVRGVEGVLLGEEGARRGEGRRRQQGIAGAVDEAPQEVDVRVAVAVLVDEGRRGGAGLAGLGAAGHRVASQVPGGQEAGLGPSHKSVVLREEQGPHDLDLEARPIRLERGLVHGDRGHLRVRLEGAELLLDDAERVLELALQGAPGPGAVEEQPREAAQVRVGEHGADRAEGPGQGAVALAAAHAGQGLAGLLRGRERVHQGAEGLRRRRHQRGLGVLLGAVGAGLVERGQALGEAVEGVVEADLLLLVHRVRDLLVRERRVEGLDQVRAVAPHRLDLGDGEAPRVGGLGGRRQQLGVHRRGAPALAALVADRAEGSAGDVLGEGAGADPIAERRVDLLAEGVLLAGDLPRGVKVIPRAGQGHPRDQQRQ
jgi:hypothetical protein